MKLLLRELAEYRELLWMLAWRDIRVRYKHTLLGAAWAVAPPIVTMLVFVFVFRQALGLARPAGESNVPYPLFALAGLVPWTFFTASLSGALASLVNNRPLVTKIYFPREVFPLAAILTAAADFLVALLVLAGMIAWYAAASAWSFHFSAAMLWLPMVVLVQIMLMAGLGFYLSLANLHYRDVGHIFRTILPLMMFVTNVLYPLKGGSDATTVLIHLNPMVPILDAYRAAIFGEGPFPLAAMCGAALPALVLLVSGWTLFHRSEHRFAEIA